MQKPNRKLLKYTRSFCLYFYRKMKNRRIKVLKMSYGCNRHTYKQRGYFLCGSYDPACAYRTDSYVVFPGFPAP